MIAVLAEEHVKFKFALRREFNVSQIILACVPVDEEDGVDKGHFQALFLMGQRDQLLGKGAPIDRLERKRFFKNVSSQQLFVMTSVILFLFHFGCNCM